MYTSGSCIERNKRTKDVLCDEMDARSSPFFIASRSFNDPGVGAATGAGFFVPTPAPALPPTGPSSPEPSRELPISESPSSPSSSAMRLLWPTER